MTALPKRGAESPLDGAYVCEMCLEPKGLKGNFVGQWQDDDHPDRVPSELPPTL
jgi:hypothetical protein